jgi:hypothetical protein
VQRRSSIVHVPDSTINVVYSVSMHTNSTLQNGVHAIVSTIARSVDDRDYSLFFFDCAKCTWVNVLEFKVKINMLMTLVSMSPNFRDPPTLFVVIGPHQPPLFGAMTRLPHLSRLQPRHYLTRNVLLFV